MRNLEVFAQPSRDWMARINAPHPFALANLAPDQRTARSHQTLKDLRKVAGMENDEAHAVEDPLLDAIDDAIFDVAVGHVSPPGQHVGICEYLVGQAVIWLVEGRGLHEVAFLAESIRQDRVNPFGIHRPNLLVDFLVSKLIPNGHAQRVRHDFLLSS
jgi:hypothetical protein